MKNSSNGSSKTVSNKATFVPASASFNSKTTKDVISAALILSEKKLAAVNKKLGVKKAFAPSADLATKATKPVILEALLAVEKRLAAGLKKVAKLVPAKPVAAKSTKSKKAVAQVDEAVASAPAEYDQTADLTTHMRGTTGTTFTPVFGAPAGRVGYRNLGRSFRVRVELRDPNTELNLNGWNTPFPGQPRYSTVVGSEASRDAAIETAKAALLAA
jgi:hypothetical protein